MGWAGGCRQGAPPQLLAARARVLTARPVFACSAPCPVVSDCLERGVHYDQYDTGSNKNGHDANTDSPEECQRQCQAHAACKFFAWFPNNRVCYFKSSDAGRETSGKNWEPGVVSGPKECGALLAIVPPFISSCTLHSH